MYGSSLYGRELYCPFNFESGYYGEPEAHIITGGVASLAVPGGEAPSTSSGCVISEPLSNAAAVPQSDDTSDDAAHCAQITTSSVFVPGAEAPSTILGTPLSSFGLVPILSPAPPRYMYSETFISGSANPYLYDTNIYDERIIEDPYAAFVANQYNTGMHAAQCVLARGEQSVQGGFEFYTDVLGSLGVTHGAQVYTPQLTKEKVCITGVLSPTLDTEQLVPMSFDGIVFGVFTCPDALFMPSSRVTTEFNGAYYTQKSTTDRIIYGSEYSYLYRNARYLGITNWRTHYVASNEIAGVLTGVVTASVACGVTSVPDIPADYLFALQEPVATFSYNVAAMDPNAGEMLPRVQYTSELYLGRSATYNGILHALTGASGASVVIHTADFVGDSDAPEFYLDSVNTTYYFKDTPCARYDSSVFTLSVYAADYTCAYSGTQALRGDKIGECGADFTAMPPTLDDSVCVPALTEAVHHLEETTTFGTHYTSALYATFERPVFLVYRTCDSISVGVGDAYFDATTYFSANILCSDFATYREASPYNVASSVFSVHAAIADTTTAASAFFDCSFVAPTPIFERIIMSGESALSEAVPVRIFESTFNCLSASLITHALEVRSAAIEDTIRSVLVDVAYSALIIESDKYDCAFSYAHEHAETSSDTLVAVYSARLVDDYASSIYTAKIYFPEFTCGDAAYETIAAAITCLNAAHSPSYQHCASSMCVAAALLADNGVYNYSVEYEATVLYLDTALASSRAYIAPSCSYYGHTHTVAMTNALYGCDSSPAKLDADKIGDVVCINVTPQAYWYDFVIDYDFSSTSDPTDMAFIF